MAKTPNALPTKPVPRSVSKPTETAEAAAAIAQAVVDGAPAKAPAKKAVAVKAPAKAVKPASADKPEAAQPVALDKPAKARKHKLVRDSFTMPKDEYQVIDALKQRALGLAQHVRKSELLRAGIQALAAMNDRAFLKAIDAVPTLKTGRPKAD